MKCPNCGSEVPPGNLYCTKCLAEIPWVKEFDTVETQMKKKDLEEAASEEEIPKRKNRLEDILEFLFRARHFIAAALLLCVIVLISLRSRTPSFSELYRNAQQALEAGDMDKALLEAREALDIRPNDLEANMLMAEILSRRGEIHSAVLVLKPLLSAYPDSEELFLEICRLLAAEGDTASVKEILENADDQIRLACSDYICEAPRANYPEGTYTSHIAVEFSAPYSSIRFTLDGSEPDQSSRAYREPLVMRDGVNVVKAVGFNEAGIESETVTLRYVIVDEVPDAPEVRPDSGVYTEQQKIEVVVPEGYTAYYAFDEVPDAESTEYMAPIDMPLYSHYFYAVLVGPNGQTSEPAVKEYYLEYE